MEEETLKVIQWNCKSIKKNPSRRAELSRLINYQRPHIMCISETWLDPSIKTPNFKGYSKILRKDRVSRDGGGLMMLIRDDLPTKEVPIINQQGSILEAQVVEVTLAREKISILHIYNPRTNLVIDHFNHLVNKLGRKFLIVGDMNGHHTLWDPGITNNQCGIFLANYILDEPRLTVATTPGLKTFTNNAGGTSTLDLTICSSNILHAIETKSLADSGSDHQPVLTTVHLAPKTTTRSKRPKWKLDDKKWTSWKKKLPTISIYNTVEEESQAFTDSIINKANKFFKKTKSQSKTKFCKPW